MARVVTFEGDKYFAPQQTFPECPYFGDSYDSESLFGFIDATCKHPKGGMHCGTYHVGTPNCPFDRDNREETL